MFLPLFLRTMWMVSDFLRGLWQHPSCLTLVLGVCLTSSVVAQINPADYGNITLHLRADTLGLANNAAVTTWGGLNTYGTAPPTHVLSDSRFNNKPVVRFDGTSNVMNRIGANLEARTIFAVVTSETPSADNSTLLSTGYDLLDIRRNVATLFYRSVGQGVANNDFCGVPTPAGSFFVNNVSSGGFVAGTPHIVLAVAGSNQTYGNLWLGDAGLTGTTPLNRFWNGSVAEVIVYDGPLTAQNINAVGWHLKTKYNVTAATYTQPLPIVNSFTGTTTETNGTAGVVVSPGTPVTFSWNVANAATVSINNAALSPTASPTGTVVVNPTATTTYTLTATNGTGSVTRTFFVGIGLTPGTIRLSELMADNGGVLRDEDGDSSDWIELFNPNPYDLSLAGWKLAIGINSWTFPAASIPGNGFLVVFASGKDRALSTATLHTNFSLPKEGGNLQLLDLAGNVASTITYGPQRESHSFGLSASSVSTALFSEAQSGVLRYLVPTAATPSTWNTTDFDDTSWTAGAFTSIGFDSDYLNSGGTSFIPHFKVDLGSASSVAPTIPASNAMYQKNASLYTRYTVNIADKSTISKLVLKIKYEDGFVAWLNGVEIARGNFTGPPAYNSATTPGTRANEGLSLVYDSFDVTIPGLPALVNGPNVLAIQGLNFSASSNDFLLSPLLESVTTSFVGQFMVPTPGLANDAGFPGFVADTQFSVRRGVYTTPQTVAISSVTPGATIRYTTNGSTPTESNGTTYTVPLNIATHTVLRARAFLSGSVPSNTDTQTYVFPAAVVNQSSSPAGWPASGVNGQILRYGFNATLKAQYTNQQLLDSLIKIPTVSLVTDQANLTDATTGIYVNADMRGAAWERPASLELIHPDGVTEGFKVNCGVRIRGGASRADGFPKHGFHLFFRKTYGDASLKYRLFGENGADEFEAIDLRTEQNYNWARTATGTDNTAVREVFCRDLLRALGQESSRSNYVHLYLNGQYWGLSMWDERKQQDFGASYFGGKAEDYDVVQTTGSSGGYMFEIGSGQVDAWQTTWNLARACAASPTNANYFTLLGRNASGVRQPAMPVYVDPEHLATYMLLFYYTGDGDAPLSGFLSMNRPNNWRGLRNRLDDKGWRFFPHDCEHTVTAGSWRSDRTTGTTAGANRSNFLYANSEWIHEDLALNPEYKLKIADVAQKHLLNGGTLTSAKAQALFDARATQIDEAILADLVRWGQSATDHTMAQWRSRLDTIRSTFFPSRTDTVLTQLKTRGFYPSVNPPTFSKRGGLVALNSTFTLSNGGQSGTMYYTTDGSDPRAVGGAVASTAKTYSSAVAVTARTLVRTRFRSSGSEWSALDEVTFVTNPAASSVNLVISKIHYHPSNPTLAENPTGLLTDTDFEYVELLNKGAATIDLEGVVFDQGITFAFTGSAITTLAPGARVLVVSNPTAFAVRYGAGLPVAGAYLGSLVNSGETIRLVDALGAVISQVTYDDASPWPTQPDGFGSALVLSNSTANPADAANWLASSVPGGVPGGNDVWTPTLWRTLVFTAAELADPLVSGGNADPDGDGWSNLLEFALGTSPKESNSRPSLDFKALGGVPPALSLTARVRDNLGGGVSITVEGCDDLSQWSATGITQGTPVSQNDGTSLIIWQDTVTPSGGSRFLRIRVVEP